MKCKCGCGQELPPLSRTSLWRLKVGQDIGYIRGHHMRGLSNKQWKGGRIYTTEGYIIIRAPEHPNARKNGYILEHRYLMSQHLHRPLLKGEVIHHLNGNITDNRIENLILIQKGSHSSIHNSLEGHFKWRGDLPVKMCPNCGGLFIKARTHHMKVTYCSRKCWLTFYNKSRHA